MPRRSRRHFRLKLKSQTINTIATIGLMGLSGLVVLSFFQEGTVLAILKDELMTFFGWGAILLPFVFLSFAFITLGTKSKLSRPHIPVGLALSFFSLLALTQAGLIGTTMWTYLEGLISGLGSFIILSGFLVIGLTILFNTSIDQVIFVLIRFFSMTQTIIEKHFLGSLFSKKEPVKIREGGVFQPMQVKGGDLSLMESKKSTKTAGPVDAPVQLPLSKTSASTIPTPKTIDLGLWEYPPLSLLSDKPGTKPDRGDIKKNASIIEKTLESFGISARVAEVNLGPAVTQYALEIALGTKISKITALGSDLALALAAPTGQIRIEAPIPGRSLVGIEIPNRSLEVVTMRQMLLSDPMRKAKSKLAVCLGLDVSGQPIITDIARMPHVLIAGTTGSGKSVLINAWISALLFRTTPNEVKFIMVDPKRVELTGYNGIPHLLTPVIVEVDKIISALKWALSEMDRRYKLFAEVGVRNIDSYHEQAGFQALPYILVVVDELADLMAYAPVEVEDAVTRLAQMARATGIHLVVATQRPSVDVITGLIKANIPARIAFNVSSMIDSRVILDSPGAEKLLGRGDMLYIPPDQAKATRIQGTFISEPEVSNLVDFLKKKNIPVEYTEEVTNMPVHAKKGPGGARIGEDGKDDFFMEAVRVVCQYDRASASLLQRRLSVGYARAARILDQLEAAGIVGPGEGSKPRDVLVRNAEEFFAQQGEPTTQSPQSV